VIVLARNVIRLFADQTGLVVPSAPPLTHHRIGEPLRVRGGSVPRGSRHEYLLAPA
jgi:hypothetical protein